MRRGCERSIRGKKGERREGRDAKNWQIREREKKEKSLRRQVQHEEKEKSKGQKVGFLRGKEGERGKRKGKKVRTSSSFMGGKEKQCGNRDPPQKRGERRILGNRFDRFPAEKREKKKGSGTGGRVSDEPVGRKVDSREGEVKRKKIKKCTIPPLEKKVKRT